VDRSSIVVPSFSFPNGQDIRMYFDVVEMDKSCLGARLSSVVQMELACRAPLFPSLHLLKSTQLVFRLPAGTKKVISPFLAGFMLLDATHNFAQLYGTLLQRSRWHDIFVSFLNR
jgi:hypothetical protein